MQDPNFQNKMKTRWDSLREDELSNERITFLIDSMANSLSESQVRNYERWPILGTYVWPNQYIGNTYAEEVAWFKNWIITRANWMDASLPGEIITDPVTGIDDEFMQGGLSVYPNPGNDIFTFEWQNSSGQPCEVQILNLLGQEIFSITRSTSSLSWKSETAAGNRVQCGIYIVRIKNERGAQIVTKLIKE
jgi:hypothetical protein